MKEQLNICKHFKINQNITSIYPYGSGHINDTYKVETTQKNYLLQRINHHIFQNVEGLMQNLVLVTDFLKNKLDNQGDSMQTLTPIKTNDDTFLFIDGEGNNWRVFDFMEGSRSFDLVENTDLAFEGGKAYGLFVKLLSDFHANELVETIPRFHSAKRRIDEF